MMDRDFGDDGAEICRICAGVGCDLCGGFGEVPRGTFDNDTEEGRLRMIREDGEVCQGCAGRGCNLCGWTWTLPKWERVGTVVYELTPDAWERGGLRMVNRWSAGVNRGKNCSAEHAESVARLMAAAPDLAAAALALQNTAARCRERYGYFHPEIEAALALSAEALRKAGASPAVAPDLKA